MILDVHTHLAFHGIYPQAFVSGLLATDADDGETSTLPSIVRRWLSDETGGRLVAEMDKAGVTKSVLLMIDGGIRFGDEAPSLERAYAVHHAVLKRWPDRFLVFGGADPRRGRSGFDLFRRSVVDWGFAGLKLYPPMGFSPADHALDDYLDVCAEHDLPVMTHSGDSLPSLANEFAHPRAVADLARRRPDVRIIMAHGGYALADPEVKKVIQHPNVWVDLAGFQTCEHAGWEAARKDLTSICDAELNGRVLFGSDYPLFHFSRGVDDDVRRLLEVFEAANGSDERLLENVLWRNAQRVLCLDDSAASAEELA